MEISYEAIELVARMSDVTDKCLGDCLGDLAEDMRAGSPKGRALRVAAVIESHVRSAQVAVLREMSGELWRAKRIDATGRRQIERKADELEAGAGQTEVRNA